uniref:hypothetical protein n=1 Tax=Methylobacterium sp. TaxID=409 RepID=UPI0020C83415|nr:hypothetical protein [Methylobacterium sp.]USU34563.1 hypothetical protein NG677_23560 [Methylobacterium sp.]
MSGDPRPATFKDAFFGAIWVVLGSYIGGGAIWTWLFWPDQTLDPSRLLALVLTVPMFAVGLGSISAWLKGEWFEGNMPVGRQNSTSTSNVGGPDGVNPPQS